VAKATHGQTTGEILGNGDASQAFQNFALHQKPLTYLSAATPEGAQSTLSVSVNEIEWHETGDLAGLAPTDREYITQTDDNDQTTVIFGNGVHGTRVPTGSANLKATYRYGIGSPGNVDAGLISQLATHPGGLQGVINPLPSTGGADRDSLEQVRGNAPFAAMALDRLVSVQDYADFARTYAGIGKASATLISDGRRQLVHLTIAGAGDIPIDQNSDLYQNFVFSLQRFGDPFQRVQVCVRKVRLLVISAGVQLRPDYDWEAVEPQIRAAVLAVFNFDERDLGQPAFLSEVIAAIQAVEGVLFSDARVFDSVSEDTTVDELAKLAATLKLNPYVAASLARLDPAADPAGDPCARIRAAELVFLTPDIPETLILTNIGA
jgi:predicted phage baseplate assembly protein